MELVDGESGPHHAWICEAQFVWSRIDTAIFDVAGKEVDHIPSAVCIAPVS